MSYTTVKLINTEWKVIDVTRLSNSWGCAAYVWGALAKRYLNDDYKWLSDPVASRATWDLYKDDRLQDFEKIVLASTFDYAIIEYSRFEAAAEAFTAFPRKHDPGKGVCHMVTIANLLRTYANAPSIGMCFQQTSVSRDCWVGEYDEHLEESTPFNFAEEKHYFVFSGVLGWEE